jgi:hypothetical protein
MGSGKRYTREFQLRAARLVIEQGYTQHEVPKSRRNETSCSTTATCACRRLKSVAKTTSPRPPSLVGFWGEALATATHFVLVPVVCAPVLRRRTAQA